MKTPDPQPMDSVLRAESSKGSSAEAIYQMVCRVLRAGQARRGSRLLDIGCGRGGLRPHVSDIVDEYHGADIIRYEGFPTDCPFARIDLDAGRVPLPDASIDIVVAVETIEHLENPRALLREMRRLTKPGGQIVVTTPNQLSLLSKLTLLTKNQFNAFQESPGLYPAHITALLEIDLIRMARELGLGNIIIAYSGVGRIPFTPLHYPLNAWLPGRLFSDNLALSAVVAK